MRIPNRDHLSRPLLLSFTLLLVFCCTCQLFAQSAEIKERSQIPDKYKWDLTTIYKTDQDWENDIKAVQDLIPTLKSFQGKIGKSSEDLLAFLKASDEAGMKLEKAYAYASFAYDQDTRNQKYTGYKSQAAGLYSQVGEASSWFTPELIAIPEATFEKWYASNPKFAVYRHLVDNALRGKIHTLSSSEERILALSGDVTRTISEANTAFRSTDLKFPTVKDDKGNDIQLSEGRLGQLQENPDVRVRRDATITLLNTYGGYKNAAAALMSGNINGDLFYARARNYKSCLHASLDGDNIDTMVYLNLISTVKKNAATLQKYVELRRRALKLNEIHLYDMSAPLIPESRVEIKYDDAVKNVLDAVAPLGKEYVDSMRKAFDSRWVDVYETKSKEQGAYSGSSYLTHPFILMNYDNTQYDMFTLGHEMGHCMHQWYTNKNQPYTYSGTTLFNAEVASTFNEALIMDYLMKKEKDPQQKMQLINRYIDNIRGTVITQVLFADFELKMHRAAEEGTPLTAENLGNMYLETMKEYYGNGIVIDPEYAYTWIRIPHFYRNFYVYKYATSFCASQALSQKVLKGEKGAREAYMGYLKGGASKYPIQLVKDAGADLTTPATVEASMKKLSELVDELEKLLKETKRI